MNRRSYAQRDCDRIARRFDNVMRQHRARTRRKPASTARERFAAIATVTILAAIPFAIFYVATN